jgi:hypothetical protein
MKEILILEVGAFITMHSPYSNITEKGVLAVEKQYKNM